MSYDAMCGYKLSDNNGLGLDVERPYLFDMTISASSNWNNYDNRWEFEDFIRNKAVEVFTEQEDCKGIRHLLRPVPEIQVRLSGG